MNQQGEEEVFRLLIGAVLGLAMLLIILAIVAHLEAERFQISQTRFLDGFNTALNTPTGETIAQKDLVFRKGTIFTSEALSREFNIQPECVSFSTDLRTIIIGPSNNQRAETTANLFISVYYQCEKNLVAGCETSCTISFGEAI